MKATHSPRFRWIPQSIDISHLPPAGRIRLMDVVYGRIRTSMAVMMTVLLPFLWAYSEQQKPLALTAWVVFDLVLVLAIWLPYPLYRRDRSALSDQAFLNTWNGRIQGLALTHGLGLSFCVLLAFDLTPAAFLVLMAIALGHIASIGGRSNGSWPLSSRLLQYLAIGINPVTLLTPWVFPDQWMFILPLTLIYAGLIYRSTQNMFRSLVSHIELEQESKHLAALSESAKEAAETALLDRSLFLAIASHDLRQPVHAMSLLVEAVARRSRDPAIDPMLSDLRQSMETMSLMFGSLLDLSRLDTGHVTPSPVSMRLAALLAEVEVMFREQAARRGLSLRVHIPPSHARVFADPLLIRQALVNLVHNGLRYTASGGLLLGARRRGAWWQMEVWDTGVGIAHEDGVHIFSPFYRNEHAWRADSSGLGLGLSVVARCARLMGAEFGFQSRLGSGSRFWLRLTAFNDGPSTEPTHQPARLTPSETREPLAGRCLVVDDDPQALVAWRAMLGSWGIQPRCVGSAAEAFTVLDQGFSPQAIFCDQRLRAGESGFDTLRTLLNRCPGASGAMISGEFGSRELQDAEAEGYIVLHKPVDPAALHAVLSTWLDQRMSPSI